MTGNVTGEGKSPSPASTVSIPELGLGATTRDDGSYSIFILRAGHATSGDDHGAPCRLQAEERAHHGEPGTTSQDFVLEANPLQLGEVVVTGAGTATEVEKLGNVRNAVSPELIVKSNEANLVQALAGKAPNVQVAQSSGDPGAGSKVTIRGLRT